MDEATQINSGSSGSGSIQAPEKMDISKTTVTVLVLITLMISVIGTWTVLNEISSVKATTQHQESSSSGRLSFSVGDSDNALSEPVSATGKVALSLY